MVEPGSWNLEKMIDDIHVRWQPSCRKRNER